MITKTTSGGNGTSAPAGRPERRRMVRFAVVGGTSVLVDFLAYRFLSAELSPNLAKGCSFAAGMVVGFIGNKYWTFESKKSTAGEPITYIGLYAVTLAVNIAVNAVTLGLTGWNGFAFLAATGTTTVLNYLGLRWLTFRAAVDENDARQTHESQRIAA
jgi:putative flippase GtrA